MRATLAIAALLLCGAERSAAASETLRFTIDGLERRVLVYAPDEPAAEPPPIVIVYHGRGDDAAPFAAAVKLHEDWPEAVIAYPRGEPHEGKPMRGWQYRTGQYADRDLKLTDALLAELVERHGTPPERRFAAGFSNGGHFVFLLMDERPDAFAAHAVIGSVRPDFASGQAPRPLMYLFGRGEPRRYQDDWQQTIVKLADHQRGRGGLVDAYGCCKRQDPSPGGATLIFGTYNAGHIWPAGGNVWLRAFFEEREASDPSPRSQEAGVTAGDR